MGGIMKRTPKIIARLAERLGFTVHGTNAIGRVGSHWFSLHATSLSQDTVTLTLGLSGMDEEKQQILRSYFVKTRPQYLADLIALDGTSARFSFHKTIAKEETFVERISGFLTATDAFLSSQGVGDGCYFCGAPGAHGAALYTGTTTIEICEDCFQQLQEAVRQREAEGVTEGSYGTGLAGAALGGLIGIIPWVLVDRLGYVSALCGLFTAWISSRLYRSFKGKAGPAMPWIIGVCVALSVLASTSVSVFVSLLVDESFEPIDSLLTMFIVPFIPETAGIYWGAVGLGLLFAALGSWGILRKLNFEGTGANLKIERV
jgi:hypothetical protein